MGESGVATLPEALQQNSILPCGLDLGEEKMLSVGNGIKAPDTPGGIFHE